MRNYKTPKKYLRRKKEPNNCQKCGKKTEQLYIYVDGNNISITHNSPYLCRDCYEEKYGKEIR